MEQKGSRMKAYIGTFKKKDGSLRTMTFAKMADLPQQFLTETLKGGKSAKQNDGSEVVYDLDLREFRVFNWNTVVGEVVEKDINF
jgi:hypothetical protein